MLHVPRSSFHEWRSRALTATAVTRAELVVFVGEVFTECRQTYRCRRIARELNARGTACSVGLVADLMREMGLKAVQPRAYRVTTVHGVDDEYPVDLIERDFTSQQPGTRLVGDITYLRTGQGWLYLATVIDLATRMVVGWQIADHMRTSLIVDALEMARLHGRVLGQCRGRDLLRDQGPRQVRRRGVHRGVLQPKAHALIDRLPHPRASPQRLPQRRTRSLMTRRNQSRDCPESLTRIS